MRFFVIPLSHHDARRCINCEKYKGDVNLSCYPIDGEYFFSKPKSEVYTMLAVGAKLKKGISLHTNLSYDFGDLYHSFSARVGVRYDLSL